MPEKIIEVERLEKSYGHVKAVRDISFSVEQGEMFSFLGVNGAGKSTTVNILCTLLEKDAGTVRIAGYDLDTQANHIRPLLGVVFQGSLLDDLLTVRENLTVRAACYGMRGKKWQERLARLDELLDLKDILDRPFGKLSGGQRRRADIARGLVNAPRLLFLDEPTTGLDPQTRKNVWETVSRLRLSYDALHGGGERIRSCRHHRCGRDRRGRYARPSQKYLFAQLFIFVRFER